MRLNSDGKTVAAMDLLVPRVGELIGGSQREERLQVGCASLLDAQRMLSIDHCFCCCHTTSAKFLRCVIC